MRLPDCLYLLLLQIQGFLHRAHTVFSVLPAYLPLNVPHELAKIALMPSNSTDQLSLSDGSTAVQKVEQF